MAQATITLMLFAAVVNFAADLSKLPEHRPAHRAGLMKLRDEGKLALSGPFGDLKGGLMVFSVESADEVDAILKADIYTAHGIFESWTIKPWNIVVSNLDTLKAGIPA